MLALFTSCLSLQAGRLHIMYMCGGRAQHGNEQRPMHHCQCVPIMDAACRLGV
jgi:hypothetical protein